MSLLESTTLEHNATPLVAKPRQRLALLATTTLGSVALYGVHPIFEAFGLPHEIFDTIGVLMIPALGIAWYKFLNYLRFWEREVSELHNKANAASRAKSDFLANMSHEIRTPLNGMIGMLGLLEQTPLSERQDEYLETIRKSSDQLLLVINDVLDIAKIEAGQLSLEPIAFDLVVSTNDVIETFTFQARQKNLDLIVRYKPGMPTRVVGDPGRYRQILTNLIGNALKFTDEGYIYVNIDTVTDAERRVVLKIEVTDTGMGIPEQKQREIFERFTQADVSTTRKFGGTGLGLAITRELVRMMGGVLGLKSTVGEGSTFSFTLDLEKDTTAQVAEKINLPSVMRLHGKTALIVDHSPLNRFILRELLEAHGVHVLDTDNEQSALTLAKNAQRLDVMIVDYTLPGSSGMTVGKELHTLRPEVPLALHTSVGQRGDAKRFEEVGFQAYMLKPYTPEEFINFMQILIGRKDEPNPLYEGLITRHILRELKLYGTRSSQETAVSDQNFGHILVVEDDSVNQQVMQAILGQLGAKISLAGNGKEGARMARENTYDLILMDMNMPEMNGPDSATEIRAYEMEQGKNPVPIVALTANAMKEHRDQCLASGMNDYLTKPVTLEKLQQILKKWLSAAADGEQACELPDAEAEAVSKEVEANVVLDEAFFNTLTGGDPALRVKLLDTFMTNVSTALETLYVADFGSDEWRKTAHRLKGSAASLGIFALSDIAAQAEDIPEGSNKDELMAALNVAFGEVRDYCSKWGL